MSFTELSSKIPYIFLAVMYAPKIRWMIFRQIKLNVREYTKSSTCMDLKIYLNCISIS